MVRAHIAATAYPRTALESAETTRVKTMNSPKKIRFGSGHIKLADTELSDDQTATSGTLWAMDSVMRN